MDCTIADNDIKGVCKYLHNATVDSKTTEEENEKLAKIISVINFLSIRPKNDKCNLH